MNAPPPELLLVADIGGTTSRLLLADAGGQPLHERHDPSDPEADLETLLGRFLRHTGTDPATIRLAVLALAGPREGDCVTLTNLPWRVCTQSLRALLPKAHVELINDFQAAALGALATGEEQRLPLQPAPRDPAGRCLALGAGTGLGVAYLHPAHGGHRAWPTEAGHLGLAPESEEEWALARHLIDRYGRASWERILSGPGLAELHAWLAGRERPLEPPAVLDAANAAADPHAVAALEWFARLYGRFAGDMALAWQPTGGLFLLGGVTLHAARWLKRPAFLQAFAAKGRMQARMATFPVHIVMEPRAGLLGALQYALQTQVKS